MTASIKLETITQEKARKWLANNTNNRTVRPGVVDYYKTMMLKGKWDLNGETIKIAKDGTILDGQHRLIAISQIEKPIQSFVAYGLDSGSFITIDSGMPRQNADYLKVSGVKGANLKIVAAAANVALNFDINTGKYWKHTQRRDPQLLIQWVNNNPGIVNCAGNLHGKIDKLVSPSVSAGLWYVFSLVDDSAADAFFDSLVSGASLREGSPVLALRNRLISLREVSRAGSTYQSEVVALFVHAFNAYVSGRSLKFIRPQGDIVLEGYAGAVIDQGKWYKVA